MIFEHGNANIKTLLILPCFLFKFVSGLNQHVVDGSNKTGFVKNDRVQQIHT